MLAETAPLNGVGSGLALIRMGSSVEVNVGIGRDKAIAGGSSTGVDTGGLDGSAFGVDVGL